MIVELDDYIWRMAPGSDAMEVLLRAKQIVEVSVP